MRRTTIGFILECSTAIAIAGCNTIQTPTRPTPLQSETAFIGAGASGTAASIPWHCLASDSAWQAPDCPQSAPHVVHLAVVTGAILNASVTPTDLTGSASGSRVTLAWLGPAIGDPTAYIIEAGSTSGATNLANSDTGSATPALTADSVPPGTYYIRVRATDAAGVSAPSNEIVIIVGGPFPQSTLP